VCLCACFWFLVLVEFIGLRKIYIDCDAVCYDVEEELRLIFEAGVWEGAECGRGEKNFVRRLNADHKSVKGASPEVEARLTF